MANIRPYIAINGVSSQTVKGLLISELAPITKPQQRTQVETVDGRDGDIITPLGFSAYDKTVKVGLTYDYDIDEIIDFFNSSGQVVFSNEPDRYYNFAIYSQIDFNRLIRFKTADVVFHVQPFKYSESQGEKSFTFSDVSSGDLTLFNSGNYYARPIITITGSGDVDISLNGNQILSLDLGVTSQTIIIDSEEMNSYNEDKSALLNRIVIGDYDTIRLKVGTNTISFTGSVTEIDISKYSRWI